MRKLNAKTNFLDEFVLILFLENFLFKLISCGNSLLLRGELVQRNIGPFMQKCFLRVEFDNEIFNFLNQLILISPCQHHKISTQQKNNKTFNKVAN